MIIIPLGGAGVRFRDNGYITPKALVPLQGKPMLFYLLDCLPTGADVMFICHPDYLDQELEALVSSNFTLRIKIHYLTRPTRGAAETLLQGLTHITEDEPVLCLDADTYYQAGVVSRWGGDNAIFVFEDKGTNPVFSYVETGEGRVLRIAEKEQISHHACVGAYGFRSAFELRDACRCILAADRRSRGEFYTSTAIQQLIDDGSHFSAVHLQAGEWFCVGTPLQLRMESLNQRNSAKYRFCFDIDHTLVHCSTDYTSWQPVAKNIAFLRFLHAEGHTIILHTARRMRTHHGNVGAVVADVGKVTLDMLDDLDIPYHELIFGKPYAHFYIDDLAINARQDLQKATGFYSNSIEPRSFHTLCTREAKIIRKEGAVRSQIHYYLNIPPTVRHLFPSMTDYAEDYSWYEMQLIKGLPLSQLFVSEIMSDAHMHLLLDRLEMLQRSRVPDVEVDLHANYSSKLKRRFETYADAYAHLENAADVYTQLVAALHEYEAGGAATGGVIHGDAVFTNVLLVANDQLKFIDMRGCVGDVDTIFGDTMYDYAKVYQSLIGYDEILLNVRVTDTYRQRMLAIFHARLGDRLKHVVTITSSLLFSLIPLHTAHRGAFYALCRSLLDTRVPP